MEKNRYLALLTRCMHHGDRADEREAARNYANFIAQVVEAVCDGRFNRLPDRLDEDYPSLQGEIRTVDVDLDETVNEIYDYVLIEEENEDLFGHLFDATVEELDNIGLAKGRSFAIASMIVDFAYTARTESFDKIELLRQLLVVVMMYGVIPVRQYVSGRRILEVVRLRQY